VGRGIDSKASILHELQRSLGRIQVLIAKVPGDKKVKRSLSRLNIVLHEFFDHVIQVTKVMAFYESSHFPVEKTSSGFSALIPCEGHQRGDQRPMVLQGELMEDRFEMVGFETTS
jgi:hypothetical protein